ncbi:MAG: POTRA domain-containing protein [Comamonadaceae bacterium]
MAPLSGVVITVTQFRLVGNTLIGAEPLQAALQPFLNRALDYTQLQAAAAAVADVYRAAEHRRHRPRTAVG